MPSKDIQSKKITRKPPTAGDKRTRGDAQKSPSMKRPKEIQYAKISFVQQYFRGNELKGTEDEKDEDN